MCVCVDVYVYMCVCVCACHNPIECQHRSRVGCAVSDEAQGDEAMHVRLVCVCTCVCLWMCVSFLCVLHFNLTK